MLHIIVDCSRWGKDKPEYIEYNFGIRENIGNREGQKNKVECGCSKLI